MRLDSAPEHQMHVYPDLRRAEGSKNLLAFEDGTELTAQCSV
jgi:hypothetical protein